MNNSIFVMLNNNKRHFQWNWKKIVLLQYLFQCFCVEIIFSLTAEQAAWNILAKKDLNAAHHRKIIDKKAQNVIMFLGDGMGVTTLTAARIFKGQKRGETGEEDYLTFERFPNLALVKTYNVDRQVPDSAATATAYLSGVKANMGTVGVDENVLFNKCSSYKPEHDSPSAFIHALKAGKSAGLVTTTRVTHASPSALYAHTPSRDWESDSSRDPNVPLDQRSNCPDIATQMISHAIDFQVILGGGRREFMMANQSDPEYPNKNGNRNDGRDLIDEWMKKQRKLGRKPKYIWKKSQFDVIDHTQNEHVLGLFEPSNMQYDLERKSDKAGEPSISQMTRKAIEILSRNPKGYFLFVEGGRIDHAHHECQAKKALTETVAFDRAIEVAAAMTKEKDTMILVTADHSHVFSMGGYPSRGRDILGHVDDPPLHDPVLADDGLPFTTLMYANGPGAPNKSPRRSTLADDVTGNNYVQQSAVPLSSETHGGEDVAVYARGPMAHLFHRCHEQSYVAHVMMFAACIGDYSGPACCEEGHTSVKNGCSPIVTLPALISFIVTVHVFKYLYGI